MPVTYRYTRYWRMEEEEYSTLERALRRAESDVEECEATPEQIILEDGTMIGEAVIMDLCGYYRASGPIIDGTVGKE